MARLTQLDTILPKTFQFLEDVMGPTQGSAKFAAAMRIAKAAALVMADTGVIAYGDAHDELAITQSVQASFDENKGNLKRAEPRFQQPAPPAGVDPREKVEHVYDKHAQPPLTTPPKGIEEDRGFLYFAPDPSKPLEEQVPDRPSERKFTPPDPLMRSAPIAPTGGPLPIPGPTTNIGPEGPQVIERAADARTGEQLQGQKAPEAMDPKQKEVEDKKADWRRKIEQIQGNVAKFAGPIPDAKAPPQPAARPEERPDYVVGKPGQNAEKFDKAKWDEAQKPQQSADDWTVKDPNKADPTPSSNPSSNIAARALAGMKKEPPQVTT